MPPRLRIRTLKPEIWRSADLQRQPIDTRLAFIGLIGHADDEGRLDGDVALLRSWIFPRDAKITTRRFDQILDELQAIGNIRRYIAGGLPYIDIPSWAAHQKINRPVESTLPAWNERDRFTERSVNGHGAFTEDAWNRA